MSTPAKIETPAIAGPAAEPAPQLPAASRPRTAARRPMASGAEPVWVALFDPARFDTMKRMATILLASGFLPKTIKTEAQVITILIKGYELGLPPMEALTGISVIDGKPAVSPQLMLALINRSGEVQDLVIDGNDTKCTVTMTRRGRKPHTEVFTIDDARRMRSRERDEDGGVKTISLAEKYNWRQMPAVMLRWRAVSACARIVFPDVISGLYTAEEMGADVAVGDDGAMEIIDVPPAAPAPKPRPADTPAAAPAPAPADAPLRESAPAARTGPHATDPVRTPATALPSRERPADPAASGVGVDPAGQERTASVLKTREQTVPPATVKAPAKAHDGAHEQPAASPHSTTPAPPEDPELAEITPEEAHALRGLIAKAAAREGFTGKAASRNWAVAHYGLKSVRLEDVPPDVRARMREDAIRTMTEPEQPALAAHAASARNGETAPAHAPAVPAPATEAPQGAARTMPATPDQLDAIRHECTIRGITKPEGDTAIKWAAKGEFGTLEDLTAAQADRVIRALRYHTPLRPQHPSAPA